MSVAWVGAGIAAVGVVGSSMSASNATDAATDASNTQMAFEQQKYDDWQATYGAVQDNLSEYYNSISADSYTAMGLENSQQAFDTSMKRINESLAQRGITNSAVSASIGAQAELGQAEERASIRSEAPAAVAQEKSNFLQIGLGLQPGNSMSSALAQQSKSLQAQANAQEQAAGQAMTSFVNTAGSALADYAAKDESSVDTGTTTTTTVE